MYIVLQKCRIVLQLKNVNINHIIKEKLYRKLKKGHDKYDK